MNNTNTILYVPNYDGNSVSICPVKANGSLSPCTLDNSPTFDRGPNGRLTIAGGYAYQNKYNATNISQCQIVSGG